MTTGNIILIAYSAIAVAFYIGLAAREVRWYHMGAAPPGPWWQGVIALGCIALLWFPALIFVGAEWIVHLRNKSRRGRARANSPKHR